MWNSCKSNTIVRQSSGPRSHAYRTPDLRPIVHFFIKLHNTLRGNHTGPDSIHNKKFTIYKRTAPFVRVGGPFSFGRRLFLFSQSLPLPSSTVTTSFFTINANREISSRLLSAFLLLLFLLLPPLSSDKTHHFFPFQENSISISIFQVFRRVKKKKHRRGHGIIYRSRTMKSNSQETKFLQELILYAASAALSCLVLFTGLRMLDPNREASKKAMEHKKEIAKRLGRPLVQTNPYEVPFLSSFLFWVSWVCEFTLSLSLLIFIFKCIGILRAGFCARRMKNENLCDFSVPAC